MHVKLTVVVLLLGSTLAGPGQRQIKGMPSLRSLVLPDTASQWLMISRICCAEVEHFAGWLYLPCQPKHDQGGQQRRQGNLPRSDKVGVPSRVGPRLVLIVQDWGAS